MLKRNKEKTHIPIIKNENKITHNLQDINTTFQTFYKNLYENDKKEDEKEIGNFLHNITLSQLSLIQKEELEIPITEDEYKKALFALPNNKSPGLDGFPPEFYKHFWSIISPQFLDMSAEIKNSSSIPQHMNTALISVLLKPNKDPLLCTSYRPISLINTDMKIISKTLALRLETVISSLIHPDQTGFYQRTSFIR